MGMAFGKLVSGHRTGLQYILALGANTHAHTLTHTLIHTYAYVCRNIGIQVEGVRMKEKELSQREALKFIN